MQLRRCAAVTLVHSELSTLQLTTARAAARVKETSPTPPKKEKPLFHGKTEENLKTRKNRKRTKEKMNEKKKKERKKRKEKGKVVGVPLTGGRPRLVPGLLLLLLLRGRRARRVGVRVTDQQLRVDVYAGHAGRVAGTGGGRGRCRRVMPEYTGNRGPVVRIVGRRRRRRRGGAVMMVMVMMVGGTRILQVLVHVIGAGRRVVLGSGGGVVAVGSSGGRGRGRGGRCGRVTVPARR